MPKDTLEMLMLILSIIHKIFPFLPLLFYCEIAVKNTVTVVMIDRLL